MVCTVVPGAIAVGLITGTRQRAGKAVGRAVDRVMGEQIVEIGPLHVPVIDGSNLHIRAGKGVAKGEAPNPAKPGDSYANLAMVEIHLWG